MCIYEFVYITVYLNIIHTYIHAYTFLLKKDCLGLPIISENGLQQLEIEIADIIQEKRMQRARRSAEKIGTDRPAIEDDIIMMNFGRHHIHTYIHTYIHTCMQPLYFTDMHIRYFLPYIHTVKSCWHRRNHHTYIHIYISILNSSCVNNTCIHTYIHTSIKAYIHTYIHTNLCTQMPYMLHSCMVLLRRERMKRSRLAALLFPTHTYISVTVLKSTVFMNIFVCMYVCMCMYV